MSLIERYEAMEAERRAASIRQFGHSGASIPGLHFNWRDEAIELEQRLEGAVEAARDAGVASMQAAFWRARAIELGADPGEWAERDREVFGGQ